MIKGEVYAFRQKSYHLWNVWLVGSWPFCRQIFNFYSNHPGASGLLRFWTLCNTSCPPLGSLSRFPQLLNKGRGKGIISAPNDFAVAIAEICRSGKSFSFDFVDDGLTVRIAVTPTEGDKYECQISMEGEEISQEALLSLRDWLKKDLVGKVPGFDPEGIKLISR